MAEQDDSICLRCGRKMEKILGVKYVCMKCSDVVASRTEYIREEDLEPDE